MCPNSRWQCHALSPKTVEWRPAKDKDGEYEYMVSHKIHLHIIWVIFIGPICTDFGTVFKERFCANANKNFYFETFCKQLT